MEPPLGQKAPSRVSPERIADHTGSLMLRWLTALMAALGLAAAAPPHQQPTPAPRPQETRPSDVSGGDLAKAKAAREKDEREQAARDREWDAKWKKLNSEGVCKGC
jgi:hypothetical protein